MRLFHDSNPDEDFAIRSVMFTDMLQCLVQAASPLSQALAAIIHHQLTIHRES